MDSIAELLVFVLGWGAIMALIGVACWVVGRWGKKRNPNQPELHEEQAENSPSEEKE